MTDETANGQRSKWAAVQPRLLLRQIAAPSMVLTIALVAWLVVILAETPLPEVVDPPLPPPVNHQERLERFYRDQVAPLLHAVETANRESAERAIERIEEMFDRYRSGIKPFADDITGWGTRFGILRRMPGNWWYRDDRIVNYVGRKFEEHLFGEEQFHGEIVEVFSLLREEILANQNRLLREVKFAIEKEEMPFQNVPDYRGFGEEVRKVLTEFSGSRAKDSVYHSIATLIVSEVATVAAAQIVVRILATVGTSAAASAAAAGGSTATGAATGGAVGTAAGPFGTVVGIGIGLVVGVIVDWWMTDKFKERLANDLGSYLDELQTGLLEGGEGEEGLARTLYRFAEDWSWAQQSKLRTMMIGVP